MKVKMLTNVAGQPSYYSGQVVDDMENRIAQAWIKDGLCVAVREESTEKATK